MGFYGCTVSDGPALEKLMESLREEFTSNPPLAGAYQPKRNDLCAAKFVDDQWYRARVEKVGTSDAQVLYIDYGNRATVPTTKLGSLPSSFHTPAGYAKLYNLALTSRSRSMLSTRLEMKFLSPFILVMKIL